MEKIWVKWWVTNYWDEIIVQRFTWMRYFLFGGSYYSIGNREWRFALHKLTIYECYFCLVQFLSKYYYQTQQRRPCWLFHEVVPSYGSTRASKQKSQRFYRLWSVIFGKFRDYERGRDLRNKRIENKIKRRFWYLIKRVFQLLKIFQLQSDGLEIIRN